MLETIREYALERLEALVEHPPSATAGRYSLEMVTRGAPAVFTADQLTWLQWLQVEQDNLRAALDWLKQTGDTEAAFRAAGGLWGSVALRQLLARGVPGSGPVGQDQRCANTRARQGAAGHGRPAPGCKATTRPWLPT